MFKNTTHLVLGLSLLVDPVHYTTPLPLMAISNMQLTLQGKGVLFHTKRTPFPHYLEAMTLAKIAMTILASVILDLCYF